MVIESSIKIIWTNEALDDLKSIHSYYTTNISLRIAIKIVKVLLQSTKRLRKYAQQGTIEPMLVHKNAKYRYIVESNYKILYKIDINCIYIIKVFDTRQNPNKIKDFE